MTLLVEKVDIIDFIEYQLLFIYSSSGDYFLLSVGKKLVKEI